jgi:hypothetical protein
MWLLVIIINIVWKRCHAAMIYGLKYRGMQIFELFNVRFATVDTVKHYDGTDYKYINIYFIH